MKRSRLNWLFVGTIPVLLGCLVQSSHADYLGPNRTYTVTTYDTCEYGIWAKLGNCTNSQGQPSDCTIGEWECDPGDPPEDGAYYYALGTTVVEHSTTHTDPEATITGTVQCASPGENGWCIVPAALALFAHEPVPGKSILLIEGRHNGEPFACAASACTVNAGEGLNDFSYWALSSYGDSTQMGQTTIKQDTNPPEVQINLNGSMGNNGWFVSNPILTVSVSDPAPGSGIAAQTASDNLMPFPIDSPYSIQDGVHEIALSVRDQAGLSTTTGQTVFVDTAPPILNGNFSPPIRNGYRKNTITFTGSASDQTSGVFQIEIAPDGAGWTAVPLSPDGHWQFDWNSREHEDGTVIPQLIAVDNAGNETALMLPPIMIDNTPPDLTAADVPKEHAGFNHGTLTFSGTAYDSHSGIERLEFAADGSNFKSIQPDENHRWSFRWNSSEHQDGDVTPVLRAVDFLGNASSIFLREYQLDNTPPKLWITERWNVWDSGHVYAKDDRSGISAIGVSVRDDQGRFPAKEYGFDQNPLDIDIQWNRRFGDGTIAPVGSYEVLLEACDHLGNCSDVTGRVHVPDKKSTPIGTAGVRYGSGFLSTAQKTSTPALLASQTAPAQTKTITLRTATSLAVIQSTPQPPMTPTPALTDEASFGFLWNLPKTTPKAAKTPVPTRTPRRTATAGNYTFLGNIPRDPNPPTNSTPLPIDPNLLTGMAAVTAVASATATALLMRRKREEELRRIADESRAEAEASARAANRQRIITNLQNQERMANPDKYRNISTDQIPYDEKKVAFNEGFIGAVKAGIYNLRCAIRTLDFSSSLKRFSHIRFHTTPRKQIPQSDALIKLRNQIERIIDAGSFKCGQTDDKPLNDMFTHSQLNVLFSLERLMYSESGLSFLLDIYKEGGNIEVIGKDGTIGYSCGKVNGEPIRIQTFNRMEMELGEAWPSDLDFLTGGVTNPFPTNTGWGANILLNIEAFREMDANLRMTDVIRWNEVESTLYHELQHGIDYVSSYGEKLSQLQELNQEQINTIKEDFWENKHILEDFFSARYGTMIQMEARGFRREFIIAENIYDKQITDDVGGLTIKNILEKKRYWSHYRSSMRNIISQDYSIPVTSFGIDYNVLGEKFNIIITKE